MTDTMSILIVDDDVSMSKTMAMVLKRKGYNVTVADSGFDAIGMVKEKPYDMIFMDVKMPGMDGVETFERIQQIRPDAVVMMMTAFAVEELVQKALNEGAYGIIYKPLDIDKIIVSIDDVRRRKEGMLIMVVDDDPGTTATLRSILMKKGHRVGIATTGEEALVMAQKKAYDIIFIDMKLPTIDGLVTYLGLKKVDPGIIAVLITAYKEETAPLIERALAESAHSVLFKPFDMEALLKVVDEIWERKKKFYQ
jgi:two-component system, NtrC family, response regulator HydG